jgi:hypothetical protein
LHASKVFHVSPCTRAACLAYCLLHLLADHGAAQVEQPVHVVPGLSVLSSKLDQLRQRTLAHSTRLRILRDLIILGGARGRRDSGGRHPDNPARYRQRSREVSSRHCAREQAQRKHGSLDSLQEAESFCALSAAIFLGHRVAHAQ